MRSTSVVSSDTGLSIASIYGGQRGRISGESGDQESDVEDRSASFDEVDVEPMATGSDSWTNLASCQGLTEVFFGPASERPERRAERLVLARSICQLCPVAAACREAGRKGNEHGVWGGEDEIERAEAGFAPRSPSRRSVIAARDGSRAVQQPPELMEIGI